MSNPLISVGLISYNQKDYIKEAIAGVLSQTYQPLEIIISDDHSTDGTDEIIKHIISEYNGPHKIIFNRNEKNLGIIGNFLKTFELMHGELLVHAGGDDISHSNRVDVIVREWRKLDKRPRFVYHGAERIDCMGKRLNDWMPIGYKMGSGSGNYESINDLDFFGAMMAYVPDVVRSFPVPEIRHGEDFLLGWRSLLLEGGGLLLPDKLVKYRVGSGLSSSTFRWRKARSGTISRLLDAAEQIQRDLCSVGDNFSESSIASVENLISMRIKRARAWRQCIEGKTFKERLKGYSNGGKYCTTFYMPSLLRPVLLLPRPISDPIIFLNIVAITLWRRFRGLVLNVVQRQRIT